MSRWFESYGFAEILDGLIIGAYPLDDDDVAKLQTLRIDRVLNLVEDEEYAEADRETAEDALDNAGIEEYRLRLLDFGGFSPDELETAVDEVSSWLDDGHRIYLHCRAGWQRSAAVAAGIVAVRQGLEIDMALALVQARKPSADPLPHQREDLRRWWEQRAAAAPEREAAEGDAAEGEAGES